MRNWATRLYLKIWLHLVRRYSLVVNMRMVDGSSAKGKVAYTIGFLMPDGEEMVIGHRIYEENNEDH